MGHGHVYLPCSHPDPQFCSSGPEKHRLCKLSLSLFLTNTHTQINFVFVRLSKNCKPESIEKNCKNLFVSVCLFTLVPSYGFSYTTDYIPLVKQSKYDVGADHCDLKCEPL